MKVCSICGAAMNDDVVFCTSCGSRFPEAASVQPESHQDEATDVFSTPEPVGYTPVSPVVEETHPPVVESTVPTQNDVQQPVMPPVGQPTPPSYNAPAPNGGMNYQQPGVPNYIPRPIPDPSDHTAEFTAEDVSQHKIYALLVYIGGIIGIIPALLIGKDSPYLKFHVQQKMKLMVSSILITLIGAITSFLIITAFAAAVCSIILTVVNLICFFKTAGGKSVEAPIIKDIKFLK